MGPWVLKIRRKLSPYSRILLGAALVLTVAIVGASVHTEFWEPISDPRKLRALALLIMSLAVIFVPPPEGRRERRDRTEPKRTEK